MGQGLRWQRGGKYFIFAVHANVRFVVCKYLFSGVPHYRLSRGKDWLGGVSTDVNECKALAERHL